MAKSRASWAPTSLREMLRNSLYAGERILNRTEWIKDHQTGRRRRFERPPEEWVREERPDLAIIDRATFDAVQAETIRRGGAYRRDEGGTRLAGPIAGAGHRAKSTHVLSGFLACGTCGGAFFAVTRGNLYGCGWHRDRGADVCASSLRVARTALEDRIFGALRDRVILPETIVYAVERAAAATRELLAPERPDPRARRAWPRSKRSLRRCAGSASARVERRMWRSSSRNSNASAQRSWHRRSAQERRSTSMRSVRPSRLVFARCARRSRATLMLGAPRFALCSVMTESACTPTPRGHSAWRAFYECRSKRESPGPLKVGPGDSTFR